MPDVQIRVIARPVIEAPLFDEKQMHHFGDRAITEMGERNALGINALGRPAKPLSPRYARLKLSRGLRPIRDIKLTGETQAGIGVVESSGTHVRVGIKGANAQRKAAINQAVDPWYGISPENESTLLEEIKAVFGDNVRVVNGGQTMILDPGTLLDANVASIRALTELVTAHLNADDSLVFAYRDRYSQETNLLTAIMNAPKPSIMVAYMGLLPGDTMSAMEAVKHKFACYFRAKDAAADNYYGMLRKLVSGQTPEDVEWRYSTIHEDCYPPEKIRFDRVTNMADDLDLWVLSYLLTENGG